MCMGEMLRAGLPVARGLFQRTRIKPGSATRELQACEACGGTALRPGLATPRERAPRWAGMANDIAELTNPVKNKV